MRKVKCLTLDGSFVDKDENDVVERPSAYGLIRTADDILLVNTKSTNRYWLPGGEIEEGESAIEALKREVWEECGIEINIGAKVTEKEHYFYYGPWDKTYLCKSVFYECTPVSLKVTADYMPDPEEEETNDPEWVDVNLLTIDDIQFGMEDIAERFILKREV
jgi:8-oxo-dGTP pyrophosphatase MutT (NUDIX family)